MRVKELSLEFVNEHFYECEGKVCRKDGRSCSNWINKNGYYRIKFKSKEYLSHRILWILYNQQELPEGYLIDHADNVSTNNSKENLRLASRSQNNHNRKISRNNTTGIKGLAILRNSYYSCEIRKNNKRYNKTFSYTPEGLEFAKLWLEEQREQLHGNFGRSE